MSSSHEVVFQVMNEDFKHERSWNQDEFELIIESPYSKSFLRALKVYGFEVLMEVERRLQGGSEVSKVLTDLKTEIR